MKTDGREVLVVNVAVRSKRVLTQEYGISTDTKSSAGSSANQVVDSTRTAFEALKSNQKEYRKKLTKSGSKASRRLTRKFKKHHHFATQGLILLMIGVFVFVNSVNTGSSETQNYRGGYGGLVASATIDEVATAQVAKQIAQGGNLLIADNISNLADSLEAQVEFSATNDAYLAKPQIVSTDARTREDIIEYATKPGDTVSDLAGQFGVTSDSIRWANDLSGNALQEGVLLKIPPVSGLIYTVESGDTPQSLAEEFRTDAEQIVSFNDAELNGLQVGQSIIIPGGQEPVVVPTQTYFASAGSNSTASFAFGSVPLYGGNGYSYGYCTWHVANRRAAIGRPVPRNLGNANTWAAFAAAAGFTVTEEPVAGAVLWHKNTWIAGGYGHVAFVESVGADGSAVVSDMNYTAGWGAVSTRLVSPAEFSQYLFIH